MYFKWCFLKLKNAIQPRGFQMLTNIQVNQISRSSVKSQRRENSWEELPEGKSDDIKEATVIGQHFLGS